MDKVGDGTIDQIAQVIRQLKDSWDARNVEFVFEKIYIIIGIARARNDIGELNSLRLVPFFDIVLSRLNVSDEELCVLARCHPSVLWRFRHTGILDKDIGKSQPSDQKLLTTSEGSDLQLSKITLNEFELLFNALNTLIANTNSEEGAAERVTPNGVSRWVINPLAKPENQLAYEELVIGLEQLIVDLEASKSFANSETVAETRRIHLVNLVKTVLKLLDAPMIDAEFVDTTIGEFEKFRDDLKDEAEKQVKIGIVKSGMYWMGELTKFLLSGF